MRVAQDHGVYVAGVERKGRAVLRLSMTRPLKEATVQQHMFSRAADVIAGACDFAGSSEKLDVHMRRSAVSGQRSAVSGQRSAVSGSFCRAGNPVKSKGPSYLR